MTLDSTCVEFSSPCWRNKYPWIFHHTTRSDHVCLHEYEDQWGNLHTCSNSWTGTLHPWCTCVASFPGHVGEEKWPGIGCLRMCGNFEKQLEVYVPYFFNQTPQLLPLCPANMPPPPSCISAPCIFSGKSCGGIFIPCISPPSQSKLLHSQVQSLRGGMTGQERSQHPENH